MRLLAGFRLALSTLVATALVTAQVAGLLHRIEHPAVTRDGAPLVWNGAAPGHNGHAHRHGNDCDHAILFVAWQHVVPWKQADEHDGACHTTHRCATYDAATLGSGPPLAAANSMAIPCAAHAPDTRPTNTATGAIALGYFSRAPPRS